MNRLALALCALLTSCATPERPAPAGAAVYVLELSRVP